MRRIIMSAVLITALIGGFMAATGPSGAGGPQAMMEATPASSEAPATVVVTNVDDAASTCQTFDDNNGAGPDANGGTAQVSLGVTSTNGFSQMDTVTPDANGDWSQTYTGLAEGTYTVTGECEITHSVPQAAGTEQIGPFTYAPVQFVVTAPTPVDPVSAIITPNCPPDDTVDITVDNPYLEPIEVSQDGTVLGTVDGGASASFTGTSSPNITATLNGQTVEVVVGIADIICEEPPTDVGPITARPTFTG